MAAVVAVTVVAALAFVGLRLGAHDLDPSHFVRFGENMTERGPDANGYVRDDTGYDGQFYHRQARSPLSTAERIDGVRFDRPVFRTRRIAYPAVTWVASLGGRRALVPWALVGVNVAAIGVVAGAAAALARDRGLATWWGLVPVAWPGALVGLSYDLAEVMALACLVTTLLALRRRRWGWAAGTLTVGVLTREGLAVLAVALIVVAIAQHVPRLRQASWVGRREGVPPAWVGLVPLGTLAVWHAFLTLWFAGDEGARSVGQTAEQLGLPLLGPVRQVVRYSGDLGDAVATYQLVQLLVVLVAVALAVRSLWHRDAGTRAERVALVGFLLLATTVATWDRAVVYFRYPTEVVVLGIVLTFDLAARDRALMAKVVGVLLLTSLPVWLVI